ncbi:hypothetical protein PHLGIDRAFT_131070 [Phlebiopsis gigantea 11061_1 CR5-6]|uniref:Uncharacterized protein n=1 Tax=Phlebiopsis gigantea (strain 11061_1 CR5-6) TaxID=745531 RepID=A0A0C3S2I0_PHLG1|nr:hypothetical protein PHLGIDRAFT_131070 [Phlebiopsis gigantea 11061_1 CR5-6]
MKKDHEFVTGSSLHPRLSRVDEEMESEVDAYSDTGSDKEYAYQVNVEEVAEEDEEDVEVPAEYSNGDASRKGKGVDSGDLERHYPRQVPIPKATPARAPRSWSDLNLSMIVALVSPIGNWLTGSDHVKNLLLLLLLVFYLHQLIEVPWKLYHSSRPRRRKDLAQDELDARAAFAHSELRARELFFLACTIIAPFLGSLLIRHVFAAIEGADSLSWFSTSLFVLATGIRPWTHLVSRLQERTDELHTAVHQHENEEHVLEIDAKLVSVLKRLDSLERTLRDVQSRSGRISPLAEICDEMSEALDTVERTVHRQERKTESARVTHNNRLAAVETAVTRLEERQRHQLRSSAAHPLMAKDSLYTPLHPLVSIIYHRLCQDIIYFKAALGRQLPFLFGTQLVKNVVTSSPMVSPPTSPPISPYGSTQFFNGTPLETIPEAADSDSEGTYVSEPDGPSAARADRKPSRSRSRSASGVRPSMTRRKSFGRVTLDYASAIVSWPYRSAVRTLLVIVPVSMQKYLVWSQV